MQEKIVRHVPTFVVVATLCVISAMKPLPAQQARVGNVVVHGQSVGRPDNAQPPRPTQNAKPASSLAGETHKAPDRDTEQLRRLSELTPPPRVETAGTPVRQPLPAIVEPLSAIAEPLPAIAEPLPGVTQQVPRTGTRSSQVAVETQAAEPRVTGAESATELKPLTNPVARVSTENDAAASISQALELYRQSDFDQAKTMLEEICRADTKLPPPGIFLVQFAATTGQSDRIRFWLDQAIWDHPDDPEAYTLLAEFAVNENRLAEARLLVEKGVSLLGNLATSEERRQSIEKFADSVQSKLYQMREDWDKASLFLEKLAAVDRDNADTFLQLGYVAANQEQYDKSIAYFQQAIAKGVKLPTPKLIVSQIADQQGKTDVADQYFNEVMKATDIDAESIRIAVLIQLSRGKITDADRLLQQAIKSEPDHLDNLLLAGTIDLFQKDYPAAEKRFQNAILINPDSYAAAQGLAQALVELEDILKKERALAYAKSNVQKFGETPDSVATLAWVCFKSDRLVEAEYLVNRVLGTGELTPPSAYYFAEIMAAVGQTDKAVLLAKIAAGSKTHFMKKAEAETLLKKLESGRVESAPAQNANTGSSPNTNPNAEVETTTPPPIRIPGTRL
ncbi:MAG: tetratricopeptide repeat protein [Planctomycetaceae bacterium]|nr:tetratricopeptide repeat protein [Planctomycetaceae bacterium]